MFPASLQMFEVLEEEPRGASSGERREEHVYRRATRGGLQTDASAKEKKNKTNKATKNKQHLKSVDSAAAIINAAAGRPAQAPPGGS